MAEKKPKRRAQIVKFLGGNALHLRVAASVKPGIFPVQQEELAGEASCSPSFIRPGLTRSSVPLSVRLMPMPS